MLRVVIDRVGADLVGAVDVEEQPVGDRRIPTGDLDADAIALSKAIRDRLESDLDVIAFVEVINPDGIPGSGDERFRTLSSGGSKLVIGSADARKDTLDTIFKTALVIKF